VRMLTDGRLIELPARAYHPLLMELARQRLEDRVDPEVSAELHGWVSVEQLMEYCQLSEQQLNVQVCRARRLFAALGVMDARKVIERRRRKLRIGVSRLQHHAS